MTTVIKVFGVDDAVRAFRELPRRVGFKHLRIAINAGCGVIKTRYAGAVKKRTGLLSKSIAVKVTIPDASFNSQHHGKPAYGVVGVKRRAGRIMRINKQGKLKGLGAGQRDLAAQRKKLAAEGKLTPLKRESEAVRFALASNAGAVYRNPSRYAHLAGPKRDGAAVLQSVVAQTKGQAVAKISEKLTQGIETERAALVRS